MTLADPLNFGNKPGDGPLRVGGQSQSDLPQPDSNLPSKPSKAAAKQSKALTLVRDLAGGPEQIRDRSTVYLPKAPGEDQQNYQERLERSVFFNAFSHTVQGLTGFVFRRDPVLGDDVPEVIKGRDAQPAKEADGDRPAKEAVSALSGHWENIDLAGTHGDVFARDLLSDALEAGHSGIFVEYPKIEQERRNGGTDLEVRPYWIPLKKDNLLSWRVAVIDGVTTLVQLVLLEKSIVEDGAFGEKEQERYRVLYRNLNTGEVGFRLLEVTDKKVIIVVDEGTYPTQDEIPVAEVPTNGKKGLFESDPPLLNLAYLNIAHYQMLSDYFNSLHKTCVPLLALIGFEVPDGSGGVFTAGTDRAVILPVGGDMKYVAHGGEALGEVKKALDDLKSDMATLGLSMLSSDKRVAETAEAKRIDKSTSDSALAVTARGLQDGIERALGFHAKYLGLPDGGSVAINRDFENLTMTAQMIAALSNMVVQENLTIETLWSMLQAGNVLPDDFNADDEKSELTAQKALNAAMVPVLNTTHAELPQKAPVAAPVTTNNPTEKAA